MIPREESRIPSSVKGLGCHSGRRTRGKMNWDYKVKGTPQVAACVPDNGIEVAVAVAIGQGRAG
jgi:hypothetical protein